MFVFTVGTTGLRNFFYCIKIFDVNFFKLRLIPERISTFVNVLILQAYTLCLSAIVMSVVLF